MAVDSRAVPERTDFYTVVHKALRKRLFEATILAGTTDYQDPRARTRLAEVVSGVVQGLREHAEHEEQFLHPIIAQVSPEVASKLHGEHVEHDRGLDEIERAFDSALRQRTRAEGHLAYRCLARFTGDFLAHVEEEEAGQARLWELAGEARFAAAMEAFQRSRTIEATLAGCRSMLPAMNAGERAAMFRGLRDAAPSTVLAAARQLAREVLAAEDWEALQAALG